MKMKKAILAVVVSGIWITFSEFVRNEFLLKAIWVNHYSSLNLTFSTLPFNGILWMIWSFLLAYLIYRLISKFSFIETILLSWMTSFAMMWITVFNLQVLPLKLLYVAIPLSFVEILIAGLLTSKFIKSDR